MPTVELGVFGGFILAAFAGLVFITRLPYMLLISAVLFAGCALLMFGYYDVVLTTNVQKVAATNQTTVGNSTIVNYTYTSKAEQTPIINSDHDTWGWVFLAMSLGCTFFFFRVKL